MKRILLTTLVGVAILLCGTGLFALGYYCHKAMETKTSPLADADDGLHGLEASEKQEKGPEYDVLTSIAKTVPETGSTPQGPTAPPSKRDSWDVPTGVTNKVPAPPIKPMDRPTTGLDAPSAGGDLDELFLDPAGPKPGMPEGPSFKKATTAKTPSPQVVPVDSPSPPMLPSTPDSQPAAEDPRITSLPPLPDDIPDGLRDDLKELEFFALAGMREEAQNLLFELTTTYPNYAPVIMERMSLLESGD